MSAKKTSFGIKTISALFIFLLIITAVTPTPLQAKTENPYGENTWRFNEFDLSVIYKNGTVLETKHRCEVLDHLEVKVISEDNSWAEVRLKWEDYVGDRDYVGYYNNKNRTIPDYENLTFKVKKSTNIAYLEDTNEKLGFFPFYIFHYTSTDVTGDDNRGIINADRKYEVSYGTFNDVECLSFESMEKIDYYVNYTTTLYKNHTSKTRQFAEDRDILDLSAKKHYPVSVDFFMPAKFMLENTSQNEQYIRVTAGLENQPEAKQYLKMIDIGMNAFEQARQTFYIMAAILVIIVISSISAYVMYQKKGES